jgi:hypothetical protein
MSSQVTTNTTNIAANAQAIYDLTHTVLTNKSAAAQLRVAVLDNHSSILRNYHLAYDGNRQAANTNTDTIFRNRQQILQGLKRSTTDPVQINACDAQLNAAKLQQLDHTSQLNHTVLGISEDLAHVNSLMIEINRKIMAANETIVQFNAEQIQRNKELIAAESKSADSTPTKNAELVAANAALIEKLTKRADGNKTKIEQLTATVETNRANIDKNTTDILARKEKILANAHGASANQKVIAQK